VRVKIPSNTRNCFQIRKFIFELLPENQTLILENFKKYNVTNVELIPEALFDKEGVNDFYISSGEPENKNGMKPSRK